MALHPCATIIQTSLEGALHGPMPTVRKRHARWDELPPRSLADRQKALRADSLGLRDGPSEAGPRGSQASLSRLCRSAGRYPSSRLRHGEVSLVSRPSDHVRLRREMGAGRGLRPGALPVEMFSLPAAESVMARLLRRR